MQRYGHLPGCRRTPMPGARAARRHYGESVPSAVSGGAVTTTSYGAQIFALEQRSTRSNVPFWRRTTFTEECRWLKRSFLATSN